MEEERQRVTQRYLQAKFRQHYRKEPLHLPPRFGRREFGFITFEGGFVLRHRGFGSEEELYRFILSEMPAHLYHSAAYYEEPGAPTMGEKGWMGADLIFDLDADHIPGWQKLGYAGMLEAVKDQVVYLIDEFLVGDLGFRERDLTIAFSGGRGYHVHVRDPRVFDLESHERREIVDYITGTGLDLDVIAKQEPFDVREFGGKTETKKRWRIPESAAPGWSGRATRGLADWLERIAGMEREEALRELQAVEGVGEVRARQIYTTLRQRGTRRAVERVRKGALDLFPPQTGRAMLAHSVERVKGATDEPVTSDVKRLIRMIGSLHGKSGLLVVPLARDELDDFNPLVDAVPPHYSADEIGIWLPKGIETDMMDESFKLASGQNAVPEYLAIHLMCRGVALLSSGSADHAAQRPT